VWSILLAPEHPGSYVDPAGIADVEIIVQGNAPVFQDFLF